MREEAVEILSDQANAAVIRHPGRRFPGVLVQGDTLYRLCQTADVACREINRGTSGFDEENEKSNVLWGLLNRYKGVLVDHDIPRPFSEQSI